MSDISFFAAPVPVSLQEIADLLGEPVPQGSDESLVISNVRALDEAGSGDATFLDNPKYVEFCSYHIRRLPGDAPSATMAGRK